MMQPTYQPTYLAAGYYLVLHLFCTFFACLCIHLLHLTEIGDKVKGSMKHTFAFPPEMQSISHPVWKELNLSLPQKKKKKKTIA